MSTRHPEILWAQRSDKVFLSIELPDAQDPKLNLLDDRLIFHASADANEHFYEANLQLYAPVTVEKSNVSVGSRHTLCILEKQDKGWWKRLLRDEGKPPAYVKVDWNKWIDEDEEAESKMDSFDLSGMSEWSSNGGNASDGDADADDEGMLYLPELEKES